MEALDIAFSLDRGITYDTLCWLKGGAGGNSFRGKWNDWSINTATDTTVPANEETHLMAYMVCQQAHVHDVLVNTRFVSFSTYLFTPKYLAY